MSIHERLGRILYAIIAVPLACYLPFTRRTRVLLRHGDDILVEQAWLSAGSWLLPGGGIEHGESPAAGAAREVREEVGISVKPADLHLIRTGWCFGWHTYRYMLYEVRFVERPETVLARHDIVRTRWIPLATAGADPDLEGSSRYLCRLVG